MCDSLVFVSLIQKILLSSTFNGHEVETTQTRDQLDSISNDQAHIYIYYYHPKEDLISKGQTSHLVIYGLVNLLGKLLECEGGNTCQHGHSQSLLGCLG